MKTKISFSSSYLEYCVSWALEIGEGVQKYSQIRKLFMDVLLPGLNIFRWVANVSKKL